MELALFHLQSNITNLLCNYRPQIECFQLCVISVPEGGVSMS